MLESTFNNIKREPIAVAALIVSILAIVPLYVDLFSKDSYSYTFQCSEIDQQSPTLFVEGPVWYDFAALHTKCDFSNIGNQTLSIKRVVPTGFWEGIEDPYAFERPAYGRLAERDLRLVERYLPLSVAPGEAFIFDEFILIPIKKEWDTGTDACNRMKTKAFARLWEASNCVIELRDQNLVTYIKNMEFPAGAGGFHPFRDFGVRLQLVDGTFVDERMRLAWTFQIKDLP